MTGSSPGRLDDAFEVELPPAPYPGLRPFNTDEWPVFFGREQMTDKVIERVIRQHLVVVHGDSGCGKSSLIRAGVLVRLEHERARSGLRWRTGHMLPREAPLRNLATAFAKLGSNENLPDAAQEVRRVLNFGADAPPAIAQILRQDEGDNICILIDQFEELFSFAAKHGREEAQLLVDFLVGLEEKPPRGLYAILTMRSEFLGACARFKGLAETVNKTQYLLPQMDRPALIRAIREPATLYDGDVSRELAERLITDAGGGQDQLPLIQHGLMLLWRNKVGAFGGLAEADPSFVLAEAPSVYRGSDRPSWRLGLKDYQSSGGLAALLSTHADEVMAEAVRDPRTGEADPNHEKVIEHLFRALTDINADGHAIRRPQTVAQLQAVTDADPAILEAIMRRFRAEGVSFLNPYGDAPLKPNQQVDISHEALIRWWQRIANPEDGWLRHEFRDGLVWKTLLVMAGKGETLSSAATADRRKWLKTLPSEAWAERYGGDWKQVRGLLERSHELAKQQEEERQREAQERVRRAEEIAATSEQLREEQRRRADDAIASQRRQRRWTMAALGTAVIAIVFGIYAFRESSRADLAAEQALAEARRADEAVIETKAGSYWNQLQLWGDPIQPRDVATLWDLTQEDDTVRVAFVRQLASSDLLARFGLKPQPIARAVGLPWLNEAREIVKQSVTDVASGKLDLKGIRAFELVSYTRALAALAQWLDPETRDSGSEKIAGAINELAEAPQLSDQQLWALAEMVGVFGERFGPEPIEPARERLREIIASPEPSGSVGLRGQAISRAIEAMAPSLEVEEPSRALQHLVPLLGQNTDSWAAKAVPRALTALLPELDSSQWDTALSGVPPAVAKIAVQQSGDSSYLLTLMQVAEKLGSMGDQAADAAFAKALTAQFAVPNEPLQRAVLARATIPLLTRLSDGSTAINRQVADITLVPDGLALDPAHKALLRKRSLEAATAAWEESFAPVGGEPNDGRSEAALQILHTEWNAEPSPTAGSNPYRRAAQVRLVAVLAPTLKPESDSIALLTEDLLEMLPHTGDYLARESVARALAALAPKLPDTGREQALKAAKIALANTGSTEEATAWADAIRELLPDDPRAATAEIVEALKYPTATGTVTDVLLAALVRPWPTEYQSIRGEALTDKAVLEWLEAHLPDGYNLTNPPPRRSTIGAIASGF